MVLQCCRCDVQMFSGDTIIDCEDGCGVLCVECAVQEQTEEEVEAGE